MRICRSLSYKLDALPYNIANQHTVPSGAQQVQALARAKALAVAGTFKADPPSPGPVEAGAPKAGPAGAGASGTLRDRKSVV